MKRFLAGVTAAVMSLSLLAGCGSQQGQEQTKDPQPAAYEQGVVTRVAALKGPTAMGLVRLMKDNEASDERYQFTLYTAADEIVPLIAKEEVDIALLPTNLAATLYQKTEGGVQVLDINAGNVLYALSHDESLTSLDGFKGKTVYMTGKGTTPEWTLRYLLSKSGTAEDDLTIEFKSEPTEVVSALQQNAEAVGILPQPFATVALTQDQEMTLNFSLDDEWRKYSGGDGIVTGVTVVRKAFADEHPQVVAQFVADHQKSVADMAADPEQGAQLIEEYGIVKAPIAQMVLTEFNPLEALSGEQMKARVSGYLSMLNESSSDAVGGKLPDEGFYYLG